MENYFIVIIDKIKRKYYVVRTSYLFAFESIYLKKNKKEWSMMIFSDDYSERINRLKFIKGIRRDNYRFMRKLLGEFLMEG